jgi:hypothetical protein
LDYLVTGFKVKRKAVKNYLYEYWQRCSGCYRCHFSQVSKIVSNHNACFFLMLPLTNFICCFSCHNHSICPPCLKIAIAGTEGYIGVVLRPFVEQFSSKPMWQSYIRFLVIPLGKKPMNIALILSNNSMVLKNSLFSINFRKQSFSWEIYIACWFDIQFIIHG